MYAILHNHDHFSLLDAVSKPNDIVKKCVKLGIKTCAITNHGNISSAIQYFKACKDNGIKPILGLEAYICEQDLKLKTKENRKLSHLIVLAKNKQGWDNLIRAVSFSNHPDNFYYRPRLDINSLSKFSQNQFIIISGHPGSTLANGLITDLKQGYSSQTYELARTFIREDWKEYLVKAIGEYQDLFGKDNFFLETQLIDQENMPISQALAKIYRYIGKLLNVKCVATSDAHYVNQEDAQSQRILLCNFLKATLKEVEKKLDNNEDFTLSGFFKSNKYYIHSIEEMEKTHKDNENELKTSLEIAEMCEEYNILSSPNLPKFNCPNNLSSKEYILKLCQEGWLEKKIDDYGDINIYQDRLNKELKVFNSVEELSSGKISLNDYFLIDWEICKWVKNQGWLLGLGRGSAAGCLTSYLLGITNIDPIKANLSFERFYNSGRNSPGKISIPDIDCDVQKSKRDNVVEYIKNKYGRNKVAQMATFGRMQGRKALGEVLRVYGKSFEERNEITSYVPDEAKIADDLQEMKEEYGESSIILWALENNKKLNQWCSLNKDRELEGEYAFFFKQAIKLEGVKIQQGKHASAIVINPVDLSLTCPMVYDKSTKSTIVGYELNDADAAGLVKFDWLGLACLDKIKGVMDLLLTGEIENE